MRPVWKPPTPRFGRYRSMTTHALSEDESSDTTDAQIRGPIPEFDKHDHYTGTDYYRCSGCDAEATRRRDLTDACRCHR